MPVHRLLLEPPRWVSRSLNVIYRRVGYRGLALVTFGLMWVVIGISALTTKGVIPPDPNLFHTLLPPLFRFCLWTGLGLVAVLVGTLRWRRPLGFAALFIGPFERFFSYLWALIFTDETRYLTGMALYLVLTATIILFSAWPEPPDEDPRLDRPSVAETHPTQYAPPSMTEPDDTDRPAL